MAEPNSALTVLTIAQPQANHNGGLVQFGPDGYLYVGMGDGGGQGDQHGTLGRRFSFDRATRDLYIADVGQDTYEEIDVQPASSPGGENYGWRLMEGMHCFNPRTNCNPPGLTLPVLEYNHGSGCSVTGGYVYRGLSYPWLNGLYLFADYCTGITWSAERSPSGVWEMTERMRVSFQTSSFGQDRAGELYVIGHNDGTIYRLVSTLP